MYKIVEMVFGSHLYGTHSEHSDTDIKGIYMPPAREIFLNRVPKSINTSTKVGAGKNTAADTDTEFYSLHYFMELACKGETVAIDMLHAPDTALRETSKEWRMLVDRRAMFYTKNLSSLVGYARKQAAKYGVKGSRLHEAKQVYDVLDRLQYVDNGEWRVERALSLLPVGEHVGPVKKDGVDFYGMCGRLFTLKAKAIHYLPMVENFIKEYGDRARQAELNEGIDWKAVSHAFRAAYQVRAILKDGGFTYPLPETEFIRDVKMGKLHFKNEAGPALDALMDEVDALSKASTLPEEVDREKADQLLLYLISPEFFPHL